MCGTVCPVNVRRPDTRSWGPAESGLVIVDKPAEWTSHDVVGKIRYLAKTRKVGHAGTLDPMATGVLVVGIGQATKLLTYLVGADKTYLATIRLGESTLSDDAQGERTSAPGCADLEAARLQAAVSRLTGDILQVPSSVSAIKVDGRRSYARVRAGEGVELAARPVTISRFAVQGIRPATAADGLTVTDVDVAIDCSSGTYIRALARDLGSALGTGGHLTRLRRTAVGRFGIAEAQGIEELSAGTESAGALPVISLAAAASAAMTVRALTAQEAVELGHGRTIEPAGVVGIQAAVSPSGDLVAIVADSARRGIVRARPAVVFAVVS